MTLADELRREAKTQQQKAEERRRVKVLEELRKTSIEGKEFAERYILPDLETNIRKAAKKGHTSFGIIQSSANEQVDAAARIKVDEWAMKNGFHTHYSSMFDYDVGCKMDSFSICWDEHKNEYSRW